MTAPLFYARQAITTASDFEAWPFMTNLGIYLVYMLVVDTFLLKALVLTRHEDDERFSMQDEGTRPVPFRRYVEGFKQHAPIEEYRFPRDMSIKTKRAVTETFVHA